MGKMFPEYGSSQVIHRYRAGEPVLSAKDIPYEADCIFNAGVAKYRGRYVMAGTAVSCVFERGKGSV